MSPSQLERRVRFLTFYAVALTGVLAVVVLGAFGVAAHRFDVIDVERINVVEPDGRVSLVISNAARIPGPVFGGEELPAELSAGRTGSSGIVFYNAEGTESGGLITRTVASDSAFQAYSTLAFDQYNQDQTLQVTYEDQDGRAVAGVVVNDQPRTPLAEMVRAYTAMQAPGATDDDRAEAQALFASLDPPPHTQRVFVGKEGETALLMLHDGRGQVRLRLVVGADGEPRIEFLDEAGAVAHRLPE